MRAKPQELNSMYIPAAFREANYEKLFDVIEQNSFGLLVSNHDGAPFATHLPLLVDRTVAPRGCLIGHMARANPQWEQADGQTVLAVFSGPHAYISPTWYEAENVVPTWNYVAVHACGTFRAIHERDAMLEIVGQYVDYFEAALPDPWNFDPQGEYSQKMGGAIVGFQIEISRLEGKWKLNQNHPRERREKVIRALHAAGDAGSRAIADLMQQQLAEETGRPA
jgi:transcriptional regulator